MCVCCVGVWFRCCRPQGQTTDRQTLIHTYIYVYNTPNHNHYNNLFILRPLFYTQVWKTKNLTTFNGGSLGSCIDEERCELRYLMRIAQLSESSKLWTHIALRQSMPQHTWSSVVSKPYTQDFNCVKAMVLVLFFWWFKLNIWMIRDWESIYAICNIVESSL